jgi:hypothetical protein
MTDRALFQDRGNDSGGAKDGLTHRTRPVVDQAMNYVAFFGILIPFELLLLLATLHWIRRRTFGKEAGSWLRLSGRVLLLLLVVNVLSLVPSIGLVAIIVWLVGLKRLSGLDVLSTVLYSFTLGVVCFVAMMVLAAHFQVPLAGRA